jgi:hypothetical protein
MAEVGPLAHGEATSGVWKSCSRRAILRCGNEPTAAKPTGVAESGAAHQTDDFDGWRRDSVGRWRRGGIRDAASDKHEAGKDRMRMHGCLIEHHPAV